MKLIESVYEDLLRVIKKVEFLKGTRRVKLEEYSPRVLREAIINAVSHRNYIFNANSGFSYRQECLLIVDRNYHIFQIQGINSPKNTQVCLKSALLKKKQWKSLKTLANTH
jgi:hypothetical protein